MPPKETFSVRLEPEQRELLDELAAAMDRSRSYLVAEAIEQYLEYHAWKLGRIEEGRRAADQGDVVEHGELFDMLRRRYTK